MFSIAIHHKQCFLSSFTFVAVDSTIAIAVVIVGEFAEQVNGFCNDRLTGGHFRCLGCFTVAVIIDVGQR